MAYSNWGAFVYLNGERRTDKEDVGVFDTEEGNLPSGLRIFANILKNKNANQEEAWRHSQHAVLGDGPVRLIGYKSYPGLWVVRDSQIEEIKLPDPDYKNDEWEIEARGQIELDGKIWQWSFDQYDGNMIDLELTEPNGDKWTATCGFCYGAGHMDDDEPEE